MADFDWGNLGAQAVPALSTLLTASASAHDIKARGEATVKAMELSTDSFIAQQNILEQQGAEIDRELGDAMTQRGIEAMKAEATLKAAAAETGTAGGTTDASIKSVYMNQALDNAILISRARKEKVGIERKSTMDKISLTNKLAELEGSLASPLGAGLQTASAATSGFRQGYSMLPNYRRETYFD